MIPKLLVKKLDIDAKLPFKERSSDEGYDVFSNENITLKNGCITKIKTGVSAKAVDSEWFYGSGKTEEIYHNNYWLQIEGRSGLASNGIFPVGGIVDSAYDGEICVMLVNLSGNDFEVKQHNKIAQIIIRTRHDHTVEEVKDLPKGDRGDKGFGSSGF